MSLLRRRGMYKAGELPAGYKLCEWLSSKDDAYLITDYYPKIGDAVEIYFSVDRKRDFDAPFYAISEYDSGRQLAVLVGYDKYFTSGAASPAQNAYFTSYVGSEPRKLVIDKDGRLRSYTRNLITGKSYYNKGKGTFGYKLLQEEGQ